MVEYDKFYVLSQCHVMDVVPSKRRSLPFRHVSLFLPYFFVQVLGLRNRERRLQGEDESSFELVYCQRKRFFLFQSFGLNVKSSKHPFGCLIVSWLETPHSAQVLNH